VSHPTTSITTLASILALEYTYVRTGNRINWKMKIADFISFLFFQLQVSFKFMEHFRPKCSHSLTSWAQKSNQPTNSDPWTIDRVNGFFSLFISLRTCVYRGPHIRAPASPRRVSERENEWRRNQLKPTYNKHRTVCGDRDDARRGAAKQTLRHSNIVFFSLPLKFVRDKIYGCWKFFCL
jgi:hypothetical protein